MEAPWKTSKRRKDRGVKEQQVVHKVPAKKAAQPRTLDLNEFPALGNAEPLKPDAGSRAEAQRMPGANKDDLQAREGTAPKAWSSEVAQKKKARQAVMEKQTVKVVKKRRSEKATFSLVDLIHQSKSKTSRMQGKHRARVNDSKVSGTHSMPSTHGLESKAKQKLKILNLDEEKVEQLGMTIKGGKKKKRPSRFKKSMLMERRFKLLLFKPHLQPFPFMGHPTLLTKAMGSAVDHSIENEAPVANHPACWSDESQFLDQLKKALEMSTQATVIEQHESQAAEAKSKAVPSARLDNSRPVRTYVNQALESSLDVAVSQLVHTLYDLQRKLVQKDPIRAKMKRRIVLGSREVLRGLKTFKLIGVVVATNLEESIHVSNAGTADDRLQAILELCDYHSAEDIVTAEGLYKQRPVVIFSMKKKTLGAALGKRNAVSVLGIQSVEGANQTFQLVKSRIKQLRRIYKEELASEALSSTLRPTISCDCCGFLPGFIFFRSLKTKKKWCEKCYQRHQTQASAEASRTGNIESGTRAGLLLMKSEIDVVKICRVLKPELVEPGNRIAETVSTLEWRKAIRLKAEGKSPSGPAFLPGASSEALHLSQFNDVS